MHVVLSCCGCNRQLRLPQEVIGSTVRCPLCQVVFLTRETSTGNAEAIPVAEKPTGRPPPPPGRVPSLSLDDDPPDIPLERKAPEPDLVLQALPADPPPRPTRPARDDRDDDDRPRRRRADDDDDDDGPAGRERSGEVLATFRIYVHNDPDGRLRGRFEAEADSEGLRLWRGKGRVLEVPVGSTCEYLGHGHLLVPISGRRVELSPVHPDGLHDELAREVAAFVEQRSDTIDMPVRPRGPVVWMAALPFGIPVLAVLFGKGIGGVGGFIGWSFLAGFLALVCLPIVLVRRWSPGARGWGVVWVSLVGYLIVGIALRVDRESAPTTEIGPWRAYAPLDAGYRVEMPGRPEKRQSGMLTTPFELSEVHTSDFPDRDTVFACGHGEHGDPIRAEQQMKQAAQTLARNNQGAHVTQTDVTADGKRGVEVRIKDSSRGEIIGRFYSHQSRIFGVMFASRKVSITSTEARRYLDSFTLDPTTGWPPKRVGP